MSPPAAGGFDEVRLAEAILPGPEDLWGTGWSVDDRGGGDVAGEPLVPGEVPDGFPESEIVADAAVSIDGPGPVLVHTLVLVFAGQAAADRAWTLLSDPPFVENFLAGLAGDEGGTGEREVLGPVQSVPAFSAGRDGWKAAEHHAAWSVADGDALVPITVDMAVMVAEHVLVVAWLAGLATETLERGWRLLLEVIDRRLEAALRHR